MQPCINKLLNMDRSWPHIGLLPQSLTHPNQWLKLCKAEAREKASRNLEVWRSSVQPPWGETLVKVGGITAGHRGRWRLKADRADKLLHSRVQAPCWSSLALSYYLRSGGPTHSEWAFNKLSSQLASQIRVNHNTGAGLLWCTLWWPYKESARLSFLKCYLQTKMLFRYSWHYRQ